jgi:peptidyl-prolyl cis-trans isomerase C
MFTDDAHPAAEPARCADDAIEGKSPMTVSVFGRLAAAATVALALTAAPTAAPIAQAAEKEPAKTAVKDPVVATINGDKIRLSELKALHADFPQARVRAIPLARIYKPLLELMIQIRLLADAGRKDGLEKDPEVVKRVDSYRNRVLRDIYIERFVDKKVDDAALKAAYDEFVKNFKGEEEVRASHILVKDKKEAMAIIEALEKGKKFEDLAKAKSIGPSKARGGDLGWFTRKDMVKPFADAAYALKKGEHSKTPVKSKYGWHVIKVTGRRTKPAPKFEQVKARLRNKLGRKVAVAELNRLQKVAKIVRYKMDGSPMEPAKKEPAKKEPAKTDKK